jgi:hypothetical protein
MWTANRRVLCRGRRGAAPAVAKIIGLGRQRHYSIMPTVSWQSPDAKRIIRDAVANNTFLRIDDILNASQCHQLTQRIKNYGLASMLVPFVGENIVSYSRNEWTEDELPVSSLLTTAPTNNNDDDDDTTTTRLYQTRLELAGLFDCRTDLPRPTRKSTDKEDDSTTTTTIQTLLGGHDLNEEASMVFVTAGSLRTPLHSDERHGMLLHIYGRKSYFVIPAEASDSDPLVLKHLLRLRDACGTHQDLYAEDRPAVTAVRNIAGDRCYRGRIPIGSALFLPQRNLHDIESATPTISISLRFGRWDEPNA